MLNKKRIIYAIIFLAAVFSVVIFLKIATTKNKLEFLAVEANIVEKNIENKQKSTFPIKINGTEINVELADTEEKIIRGLSGRKTLGQDEGMLFLFKKPDIYSFWMKEMNFPIDIIWIDQNHKIIDISENLLPSSYPAMFRSKAPAQYVLEVNADWAAEKNVKIGAPVSLSENILNLIKPKISEISEETTIIEKTESRPNDSVEQISQNDSLILFTVPFTPQAPLGNWKDDKQQNGCEEAAAVMSMRWVKNQKLTLAEAEKEIIFISNFELAKYGNYRDTSAKDTMERIYRDYFGYNNIEVRNNIGVEDIKNELKIGNLVVVPVNGRKLRNPYYNPPGPIEHHLVVIGYDPAKKEFITNDPGTRYGKSFRYSETILENALQDYPTGYHEPIIKIEKTMIVVKK
ncbi:MAG: DUF192 domain-containing protein [Parcubacteria group bacterium]|nr:DUF192 domain-containing protein [Parcubacteria group bacterium]